MEKGKIQWKQCILYYIYISDIAMYLNISSVLCVWSPHVYAYYYILCNPIWGRHLHIECRRTHTNTLIYKQNHSKFICIHFGYVACCMFFYLAKKIQFSRNIDVSGASHLFHFDIFFSAIAGVGIVVVKGRNIVFNSPQHTFLFLSFFSQP